MPQLRTPTPSEVTVKIRPPFFDYKANGWTVTNVMENERPEIWLQNSSVLGDMVNTTFVDIIVGNQPVEYFDTFVENWLNAGGQETLDALDEMYPAE